MPKSNEPVEVFTKITMSGPDQCWQWNGTWGGQPDRRRPYFKAEGRRYVASRLVFELHTGITLGQDELVLHSCDNGAWPVGCCNPHHMRKGSTAENSDDMKRRERHGLTHYVVRNVRRLAKAGRTHASIAELYGISRESVTGIINGRAYAHVTDDAESVNPTEQQDVDTEGDSGAG